MKKMKTTLKFLNPSSGKNMKVRKPINFKSNLKLELPPNKRLTMWQQNFIRETDFSIFVKKD
jgi:hypothetical protein